MMSVVKRDERGAGSALTAGVIVCLVCAAAVAVWVSGWLGSAQQASSAADLAALAGAAAYSQGSDACAAARQVASHNHARVERCTVLGGPASFTVRVAVSTQLRPALAGGPQRVERESVAGVE